MRNLARFLLSAALAAFSAASLAVSVSGLHNASVPVKDQSPQSRDEALRDAFAVVLVRVSGDRQLPATDAGLDLLRRANNFVQGFGYETVGNTLRLEARFDSRAVDAALRDLGTPVWGANRVPHQAWILVRDDGAAPAILDADGASRRTPALLYTAAERGIPLTFPTLDATDLQLVEFREAWSGDFRGIRGAANRYQAGAVLVVRLGREGPSWLARWTLLNEDGSEDNWNRLQPTPEGALAEGMHELANRQARRFAVQTGMRQALRMRVSGVESIDAYARVLTYLRGLNPVRRALVEEVEPGRVYFRLEIEGDPQLLPRIIDAGSLLKQDAPEELTGVGMGFGMTELRYTLSR